MNRALTRTQALMILLIVGSCIATSALAAAGRTPGTFGVSPSGASTYSIPIWTPRGPAGLQPSVSLQYSSSSGYGSVGVGWYLAGVSSIYRCNQTVAQDGAGAPVTLTYADRFCMDGKRLRLTSSETLSNYGLSGTTYQTEIADFSNVTASGTTGNGPTYFTVQGKNGWTYEYGNTTDSRILADGTTASSWMLDKVTDRAGNTMIYKYQTADANLQGTTVLASISWTPSSHGSTSYNYTLTFQYEAQTIPHTTAYLAGNLIKNAYLLTNIVLQSSGTTVKDYFLQYTASNTTQRATLTSIKECADTAATNCLSPTSASYQNPTAGLSTSAASAVNAQSVFSAAYDINGDGYRDLIYYNGTNWLVALGSASGYSSSYNTGATGVNGILVGDLTGTGQDAILAANGATWSYIYWNGSGFTTTATSIPYDSTTTSAALADTDGDGLPDLVTTTYTSSGNKITGYTNTITIYIRKNQSTAGSLSFATSASTALTDTAGNIGSPILISPDRQGGALKYFDFNGDGRQDLVLQYPYTAGTGTYFELDQLISNGSTFSASALPASNTTGLIPLFVNWNNDSCTDYVFPGEIYISGCNGTQPATINVSASNVLAALDWNGDGLTDLIVQNGTTLGVMLSTGTGISGVNATSISYSSSCAYLTVDANGDGLSDLACLGQTSPYPVSYYVHNSSGQIPDLLTSVADGFGNSAAPSYVAINHGSYTKGTATSYPEETISTPFYVTSQAVLSDGVGGSYTQTYSYTSARKNIQGYGFEGFSSVKVSDSRSNSLVHKATYQTAFPFTGLPQEDDVYQNNGTTLITQATYTNADNELDTTAGNQRHFVHTSSSNVQNHEVGGSKNGLLIDTTVTSYTYDNYGNATDVAVTTTDNDTGSPYYNEQWSTTTAQTITPQANSYWCLNLPTEVTVTKAVTGVSSIIQTMTYGSPDYVNCRQNSQVVQPYSSAYSVSQSFQYDSFGNINQVTTTGAGMSARTSYIGWGNTGQFPVSVENALSQTTTYAYDPVWGQKTSTTDPNSIQASWTYDAFGRKYRENRPDGTYAIWTYNDCAGTGGCLIGPHGLQVGQTVYNIDGSVQTDGTTYLDPIDRALVSTRRQLAAGSYSRNEVQYDNYGRTSSQSFPCTWTSLTAACPYSTSISYDAVGRVTQTQRPISSTNLVLQSISTQYSGRTVTVTDPQGKQTTKVMTVAGTLGVSEDANSYSQTFSYDAVGNLKGITDSLSHSLFSASYDYSTSVLKVTQADPDRGTWTYTYDALGELTATTNANNQSVSITYDALSRPRVRTEPDLTTTWTWGSSASLHNIGQLQSVSAGNYSETYSYDADGRPVDRTISIPSDTTYSYDMTYSSTTGLLDTFTYPITTSSYRLKLQYGYQNGIPQQILDYNVPSTVFWKADAANPRGQVTQETLGNGVITNRSFDAVTGWVASLQTGLNGGAALQNESYLFDEVGNVTQRQNNNVGLTENFYYDSVYRLDHSALNGVAIENFVIE